MAAGPLLLRWAATLGPDWNIADLVHDAAHTLAQVSGETVGLTVYDPATATAIFAAEARGSAPIEYSLGVGTPIPLYAGAAGKSILAHCPPEIVRSQSLEPITPRSPTTLEQLENGTCSRSARPDGPRPKANVSPMPSGSPPRSSQTVPSPDPSPSRSRVSAPTGSTRRR